MGNTDSHSSFDPLAKTSSSLRFPSRKDEAPSARSWWRSNQGGSKTRGRSYQGQNTTWRYENSAKSARGGLTLRAGSPQTFRSQFGYVESGSGSDGICGERSSLQSGGSPKVLLSKDGSMRVEFTNTRVVPMEAQGFSGLPNTHGSAPPVGDSSLRTSKGSSLSSDGSWYDSPWGGGDLSDNVFVCGDSVAHSTSSCTRTEEPTTCSGFNTFFPAQDISPGFTCSLLFPAPETSAGCNTCSSGRTEDSGIGDSVILQDFVSVDDVYSSHNTLPAFPITPEASLQQHRTASSSALLDDVIQEEEGTGGGVGKCYSSLTLPCRRAGPISASVTSVTTVSSGRKDFLKSRIQRLSDWTGSLSRKKRRIQVRKQSLSFL